MTTNSSPPTRYELSKKISCNTYDAVIINVSPAICPILSFTSFNPFKSKYITPVTSLKSGIISDINAEDIGKVACLLGAGRIRKEDNIDYTAGIVLNKKVGDYVKENEILAYIHTNNENVINEAIEKIQNICKI